MRLNYSRCYYSSQRRRQSLPKRFPLIFSIFNSM
ncbi:hypothetical protein P301_A20656 [Saccharomyces cerevisiae P301]|nr:conserved protein [Saccharomyces cerevisiae YJM789]EWG87936.1 hypothetical protein R008_A10631 [Saccharomyces cerevisiae R008]EWG92701.1 hypothetical protein P301_A20656 [Saccharomyces cerevisiae P301]EWG97746.1 hypothetical protein R103_A10626 [Saccharomyces cerevisiae R103]EWH19740.1 hypothetical protein P283_A10651 [Saccharomyces cerevisiae P283]KZV13485.1 hypothetical protein WN66_00106 [Saccharomyces cerevisiae]CAE6450875.1 hypothetical protein EO220_0086 [Saccharomyces cerevisiae PE-